jgi:hypothetical protein
MSDAEIDAVGDNVGAMASHVGKGLPPIRTSTDAPERARLLRVVALAAVLASLVAAVVAGAAAVYPHASDASRERAEEAILPGNAALAGIAAALEHAKKLDDLAEAGAAARAATVDVELLDTAGISDSRFRTPAKKLLRAQLALLSALEPLADLDESTVGDWRRHRHEIRAAVRRIDRAQPAVAELALTPELNVWGPVLIWSLANADAVVAQASRRLGMWRSRVQQLRRARRQALAAATIYEGSVGRHLATYDGWRRNLDDWIRTVDTEGITRVEARKFLGQASAAGQNIRDRIASLNPPARVASAHTRLLASIDRAVEVPRWQRLRGPSEAVVREAAAARSNWQAAVAREVKRITSVTAPKRPDV